MAATEALRDRVASRAETLCVAAVGLLADRVRQAAPEDSGALRAGVTAGEVERAGAVVEVTLRAEALSADGFDYATAQDKGTGIYGPSGQRIQPVQAPALVFYWKKVGRVVAFNSVAGTPPTGFWSEQVTEEAWTAVLGEAVGL